MELPRRRTGSYEPRPVLDNILAPVHSGQQGFVELRTTPSRGSAASGSRPPWATEHDAAAPQVPPHQHVNLSHPPSSLRFQHAGGQADCDTQREFTFHSPATASARTSSPQSATGWPNAAGDAASLENVSSRPWPNSASTPVRPQSDGRAAPHPADQLDLWSQQHDQHTNQGPIQSRRNDGLYAKVPHVEAAASTSVVVALPPSGAAARRAVAPGAQRRVSASGNGPRLPPGEYKQGDVVAAAAGRGRGAATSRTSASTAAARVGASQALAVPPSTDSRSTGRSTSTPKPRPALPPKRSTSITDNVQRDWADVRSSERNPGGDVGRSGCGGDVGGRWDGDPDGDDRGSWLLVGNATEQQRKEPVSPPVRTGRGVAEAAPRSALDRPCPAGHPGAVGRNAVSEYNSDGSRNSGDRCVSPGRLEQHPVAQLAQPQRRSRLQSPATGALEATLSLTAATAAPLGGGDSSCGSNTVGCLSLGHGPSTDIGNSSRVISATVGATGRSVGRPGASASQAVEASRQVQLLHDENVRLREQVQYLERLVTTTTMPVVMEAAEDSHGRKPVENSRRPHSAGLLDAAPSIAAAAASSVVLQQYKSQVIQLQRQVTLMSQEIEAKSLLTFEAEGALLEVASKLADLAASSGAGSSTALPRAAAAGGFSEGVGGGEGGGEELSRDRLLQLHKWSKQMLSRLRSEKCAASKLFTQEAYDNRSTHGGFGRGPASWSTPGGGRGAEGNGSFGPHWVVPFLPAGGNRFLMSSGDGGSAAAVSSEGLATAADEVAGDSGGGGGGASMAAIATGQATLLANPVLAHRLELQLAGLGPKLAALAVLLKTQLLPAMPWLGLESADRLQAEVGEAAESVSQCVEALVALCALLPAGAAVFGDGPLGQEPKRRAAEVDAGRDSWLYGSPELLDSEPPSPAISDDGIISVPRLQAAIAPLLRDRKSGGKSLVDILDPVRARSQSASAKRAVLEAELRFAARASALHAEHVSHLMLSVGMALGECRGAKDAAAIKSYFNTAAAVRQVLESADALEVHPCETCLKALVDVIRVHRETLGRLPELLVNAPAADVEGRLLGKVEELHAGFKKAIGRLEAHKRRYHDTNAGGVGVGSGPTGDQDTNPEYGEDFEAADEDGGDGRSIGRSASTVGALPLSSAASSRHQHQSVPASKPGKPPKPRAEWQE